MMVKRARERACCIDTGRTDLFRRFKVGIAQTEDWIRVGDMIRNERFTEKVAEREF